MTPKMAGKFGERIRQLRTEQGLGLRSFAKTIGISPDACIPTHHQREEPVV